MHVGVARFPIIMSAITDADRIAGCMIGLAVGDAIGTSVEFMPPESFPPLQDMIGGGKFNLEQGQVCDDIYTISS